MIFRKQKPFIYALLVCLFVLQAGVLTVPDQAAALSTIPTRVDSDKSKIMSDIFTSAAKAAWNSTYPKFFAKFDDKLKATFGVNSYLLYQQSLVEAKYLQDAYRNSYGSDAVTATSTFQIASQHENLPLNKTMSASQARQLGARDAGSGNRQSFEKNIQKLIVGGSSLFTSSNACGGVNKNAVRNTSEYLAAASTGVLAEDIDPTNPMKFYEQMGRFGSPYSSSIFWEEQLKGVAAQKESEARQAAHLELTAPGYKSPQKLDAQGRLITSAPLNSISAGQQSAQGTLLDSVLNASGSPYDTSSFKNFATSLATGAAGQLFSKYFGNFLGGILGDNMDSFQNTAGDVGRSIAESAVKNLSSKLYDNISRQIFQGKVLAESTGCSSNRVNSLANAATPNDKFDPDLQNEDPPPFTGDTSLPEIPLEEEPGDVSGALLLSASPPILEIDRKTRISWDASRVSDSEEGISLIPISEQSFPPQGSQCYSLDDARNATEEDIGKDQGLNVTLITDANDGDSRKDLKVSLVDPQPRQIVFVSDKVKIKSGQSATLGWDIKGYPDAVFSLDGESVFRSDERVVSPTATTTFSLIVSEANQCATL